MIVNPRQIGYRLANEQRQVFPAEPAMDTQMPSRLDRMLRPRSVAIVGVSPEPGHPGGSVLANLERCHFAGDDPSGQPLAHRVQRAADACPSIDELPHGVDVAVLVVPQNGRRSMRSWRSGGAASAPRSCSRPGYAEVGETGRADQEKLTAAARAANVAVLGPNCIGMCSFDVGAALTFEFNVEPPAAGAQAEDRHGGAERRDGGDHAHGVPRQGARHHVLYFDRQ